MYLQKNESQDGGIVYGFKLEGEVAKLFIDTTNKVWKKCGRVEFTKIINNNGDFNSASRKNMTFFLPPSAANICIVCYVDISAEYPNDLDNCYKLKLWKRSEKTKTCRDSEQYFEDEII